MESSLAYKILTSIFLKRHNSIFFMYENHNENSPAWSRGLILSENVFTLFVRHLEVSKNYEKEGETKSLYPHFFTVPCAWNNGSVHRFSLQSEFAGTGACRHQAYSQLVTTNFFPLLLLLAALSVLTNVYQSTSQSSVVLFPRKRKFQRQILVNKFGRSRRSHPLFPSFICSPHQIHEETEKLIMICS